MINNKFWTFLLLFISLLEVNAQSTEQAIANGQDPNVLYRNEQSFGFFAHSRGFGLNYYRGQHVTGTRKRLLEVQLLNLKHPKEIKITNNSDNSKRFVYGKLNNVIVLRGGLGYQTTIYRRMDRKSVEIRSAYFLGGNLSFAKPNYVYIFRKDNLGNPIQTSVKYDPNRYTLDSISGKGPLVDGIDEVKIYPGVYAKANLSFEYAPYSNSIKAIETGIIFDYYPKALPIMARNPTESYIVTLYVAFVFGKKWF